MGYELEGKNVINRRAFSTLVEPGVCCLFLCQLLLRV